MSHNNKKCLYDGYKFDSYAERDDYIYQCNLLQVKKVIVKPTFVLQTGFKRYDGKTIRSITFTPDLLVEFNDMSLDIEGFVYEFRDTKPWNKKKGKFVLEGVFKLKWKWLQGLVHHGLSLKYNSPSGNGLLVTFPDNRIKFTLTS